MTETTGNTAEQLSPAGGAAVRTGMFQSARFKLTLFYLAIIVALSIALTVSVRALAQYEYERGNVQQRGAFRVYISRSFGVQRPPDDAFGFQHDQEMAIRAKLDFYLLLINLSAFVFGGVASYWFAGRTLRPIEQALEAQKRFASDASHELRTPLTAIRTENEVFLRQKDFDKQEARELIQSNLEEVDRLERLASNLLLLTQLESMRIVVDKIAVKQLVEDAVKQTNRIHPTVQISHRVSAGLVLGQQETLVQLFSIILDNACKYGKGTPVVVAGKVRDGKYVVTIDDNGPGIAEADLPRIFDRLYRGDKARSQAISGHGLGLALAQHLARANGAYIEATNRPEGGARFTVVLERPHHRTKQTS